MSFALTPRHLGHPNQMGSLVHLVQMGSLAAEQRGSLTIEGMAHSIEVVGIVPIVIGLSKVAIGIAQLAVES
tara:strand:- start:335 stop:550 length:216 start_codon:yes stop_codon:yes gene_type:complete